VSKNETASCKANETEADRLSAAIAALKRGEVIVFPTETLYGLGADARNPAAVDRVCELKGRDSSSPISVLIACRDMLGTIVSNVPALAEELIAHYWPGPLTLVLPARKALPRPLLNSAGAIGVRISSDPTATELVNAFGNPLTATSANPSGKTPARTIEQARNYFSGPIEIYIDGGARSSRTGSTVAEVFDDTIHILREGEIGRSELERFAGRDKITT
jgi:L-threonylcarbamoyladenylate synthase